jgi:hypothetical protein
MFEDLLSLFFVHKKSGWIQHASLPKDTKHPIALSCDSHLAAMIILHFQPHLTHAKTERLLSNLRATYYILQPRASEHAKFNMTRKI